MPPTLSPVTAETVAARIELRPETIDLAAARAIYLDLAGTAGAGRNWKLQTGSLNMATALLDILDAPVPDGLVSSSRLIIEADNLIQGARNLRDLTARTYDRFRSTTREATEALEILTAWGILLEAADLDLRHGALAA